MQSDTSITKKRLVTLVGPAFVAAVAYVDPGNVAANITAGARYGYTLVWVLVLANLMAVLIQYQSAKLGIVTGKSLPTLLGERLSRRPRLAFWVQAEVVAGATDLAEVMGGAIALNLLFDLPLVVGGIIVGAVSIGLLSLQNRAGQRVFEGAIIALLLIITLGFVAGLLFRPPTTGEMLGGMIPGFAGKESVLIAASMLGATVMPHAIYLHSSLVGDRHGRHGEERIIRRLLRASKLDVLWALVVAGLVNIALLLLAASALNGKENTDTIEGAYQAIFQSLGPTIATVFAVGLLASGLASTSVGAYAGAEIMQGLLRVRLPLLPRRLITLIPALLILSWGAEPTWALVISQVILSLGIPMALIPLIKYTRSAQIMGKYCDPWWVQALTFSVAALIVALNLGLIWLTCTS